MRWLAGFLTWLSADPQAVQTHAPRAAASAQIAYATMAREARDEEEVEVLEKPIVVPGGTCPDGKCPAPRK